MLYGQKRYSVLSQADFAEYAVRRGLSREDLARQYGVPSNVFNASSALYGELYREELAELKHARYAAAMRGNTRGKRSEPSVLLDEDGLRRLAAEGKSLREMAAVLGTSAWYVRQNLLYRGITANGRQGFKTQRLETEYIDHLERFAPGFRDASTRYYTQPAEFFDKLYEAFLGVSELLWVIREQGASIKHYQVVGRVPRNHVSFSLNKCELLLSRALLNAGLAHVRPFTFGRYAADFAFPAHKLFVEVDGDFHTRDAATKERDRRKAAAAKKLGYTTLRFTTAQVEKEVQWVLNQIRKSLHGASNQSNLLDGSPSGTSR